MPKALIFIFSLIIISFPLQRGHKKKFLMRMLKHGLKKLPHQ